MKFADLSAEYRLYQKNYELRCKAIIERGLFLNGPERTELEARFRQLTRKERAITVKNGTDAITLLVGILWKPGMKVILPNFGAYPTAFAVAHITGPRAIHFVDVDNSLLMDPEKLPKNMRNGIIIPVNLFGFEASPAIFRYARKNGHQMILDCAQSFHARNAVRTNPDRETDVHYIFSFYPTKNMGSYGDGGMICTDDLSLTKQLYDFRFYGYEREYHRLTGMNSRMDEWQCAVVNAKLADGRRYGKDIGFLEYVAKRYFKESGIYNYYLHRNARLFLLEALMSATTGIRLGAQRHQYPILFRNKKQRDIAMAELERRDIPYMIHYEHHVSELPAFKENKTRKPGFRVSNRILSLPFHAHLMADDIEKVCNALKAIGKKLKHAKRK